MSNHEKGAQPEPWKALLKQGLDQASDLQEEPPNLAALQMLVTEVQAEQKRRLYADLLTFWAVAAVVLAGLAFALQQQPVFFLVLQGSLALLSLAGALLWHTTRGRVTE